MGYLKDIGVGKKHPHYRDINLAVGDTLIPEAGHLSDLDLESVTEIIPELNNLINSKDPSDYLHWGGRFIFSAFFTINLNMRK